jgi:hypothetical protein
VLSTPAQNSCAAPPPKKRQDGCSKEETASNRMELRVTKNRKRTEQNKRPCLCASTACIVTPLCGWSSLKVEEVQNDIPQPERIRSFLPFQYSHSPLFHACLIGEYERTIRRRAKCYILSKKLKLMLQQCCLLLAVLVQWDLQGVYFVVLHAGSGCLVVLPRNWLRFLLDLDGLHLSIVRGAGLGGVVQ